LFIADFDDDVIESNELNNIVCVAITILEIGSPDLICNINSVTPFLYPGENLDISITIENIGDVSATPEFISRIKLSKDDCILLDDILLENIDVPELIPGGSYTYVQTYSIWDTLSSGNYNLLIKADGPDDILESNESNNTDCSAVEILSPMGCEYTLSSSFQSYDALAYSDNITITTSEIECFWAVTPPPPFWITSITSSGIGFGVISFSIQNNPEITSRSFTFSIESETFTIFQEGLEDDPGVAPVADFYALTLEGCAPLEVSFFDLSSNEPSNWSWTFGGGEPELSTDQNPENIIFGNPGVYTIVLNSSNILGSDIEVKEGYIIANKCVDILSQENIYSFDITPNPAVDFVTIEISSNLLNSQLVLYNTVGAAMRIIELNNTKTILINLINLPKGIYFAQLNAENIIINKPFVLN